MELKHRNTSENPKIKEAQHRTYNGNKPWKVQWEPKIK